MALQTLRMLTAKPRRIAITGIGAITPIGSGRDGLWHGVLAARSAVRPITQFDASTMSCRIAAEVGDTEPPACVDAKQWRRLDRCSRFALAAASQALDDAGLGAGTLDPRRAGVCVGSALGGAAFAEREHEEFLAGGLRAASPMVALQMFVGAAACNVAIVLDLQGYGSSNADSCASGAIAIGNAAEVIRRGDADVMFAGGAEAPLAPLCFGAFALIRAMSTRCDEPERACRPFDRDRDGFVMGEGAAILTLEAWEHAVRRGARIYAELAGFGCTNDAYHMTAPRPDAASAARCIALALEQAGVPASEIDYINAHGSGTVLNDPTETRAIRLALGDENAERTPVSGTKAMHGHALGATGAIEAAICCLAIEFGWIPPTINLETSGPGCDLDYVPHAGRAVKLRTVLSNSFGFGGINAALVLRQWEPEA